MFNRAGYRRIFIEAVRHRGETIHICQIRGGGVSREELSQADLWDEDYDPGELVFPDNKQRVRLTWLPSPLVYGGRLFFVCPDCERRCCELFRFYKGVGPWKCRKCLGLVYHSSYKNRYQPLTRRGVNYAG